MLTIDQIEQNKVEFLKIISEIDIPGARINELVEFLEGSDFFTAPASTQYHNAFQGGLCAHSLNVYKALLKLVDEYCPNRYEKSTLIVVALLHDLSKANFYESYVINKKIYDERGSKSDNHGRFDWFAQDAYKVREPENRFLAGTHEENSMLLVGKYIPLSHEEVVAIMNHHLHTNDGNSYFDQSSVCNRYPLVTLLHTADLISTFCIESVLANQDIK